MLRIGRSRAPGAGVVLSTVWIAAALVAAAQPPAAPPPPERLSLTLEQAIDAAVKNNVRSLLAEERISESRAQRGLGMSALLPNLSGAAYQMNLTANLAAEGLPVAAFPGMPAFIGPFSRFDARFQLLQSVFNLAAIRRYQAGAEAVALANHERRLAVEQVTAAAAFAYLSMAEAQEAVAAADSNARLAGRLLELATSQRDAGVATGVDVARAETRLANQRVQVAQARANLDVARLNLLRMIGAPLASEVTLADPMRFQPAPAPDAAASVRDALANRVEIQVAQDQVRIAEKRRQAAGAERLPSVEFFGDYGSSGLRPDQIDLPTRSVGLRLDVPVFDGGRTRSEMQAASSRQRQAELQLNDLRAAVEKDVRQALDLLSARDEQVRAAQTAVSLSQRELELSQDRFQSGVGDNVEVVNAQTALENARLVLVSSLAQFNAARLNLASALGRAADFRL